MTGLMRVSGSAALIIGSLYGTLYVLLQLEAFALLAGTGVLFVGLVALMASTRSLTSEAT
jgi:inner membrane protein involved in colicin E2 resistance